MSAAVSDSSGGHTVLMAGFTGGGELDLEPNSPVSCRVRAIVDCYGPADLPAMYQAPSTLDHRAADGPVGMLLGGVYLPDHADMAAAASPIRYAARAHLPPTLIVHGSIDPTVPFEQSVRLFQALRAAGNDCRFVKIPGAGHGTGGFRSAQLRELVCDFLRRKLCI